MSHNPDLPEPRFYELDILRGLAAIMVVTFHYKHFLFISDSAGFDTAHLPFPVVLAPLYVYGQWFVELFFSISGYVFFWLYSTAIADRHVSGGTFFISRFARLYPLFLVTLIVVAMLQAAFRHLYGTSFIYHTNTPGYFAGNLLLVQEWFPGAQMSFNGPGWSISVEVFLYAVFFALCFFRWNTPVIVAIAACFGMMFKNAFADSWGDFARGAPNFFFGGLIWYAGQWLEAHPLWRRRVIVALACGLTVAWPVTYAVAQPWWTPIARMFHDKGWSVPEHLFSEDGFVYLLLPLSLLLVVLLRGRAPQRLLHRFGWLGDISYSLYLWHFPLQVAVMLVMARSAPQMRMAVFGSPLSFIAFMAVACGLAWLSYRWFEMPARRALRLWMTRHLAPRPALR